MHNYIGSTTRMHTIMLFTCSFTCLNGLGSRRSMHSYRSSCGWHRMCEGGKKLEPCFSVWLFLHMLLQGESKTGHACCSRGGENNKRNSWDMMTLLDTRGTGSHAHTVLLFSLSAVSLCLLAMWSLRRSMTISWRLWPTLWMNSLICLEKGK